MFVVALALSSGCLALDEVPEPEPTSVEGVWDLANPPPLESVTVDARQFEVRAGDFAPAGPCSCNTAQCYDEWVVANFGCGVCVTVICESGQTHGCSVCDNSGEPGVDYDVGYETRWN